MSELKNTARLVRIMARLRGEAGCPWDRAQTLESLEKWLLEETYEVLEAIQSGDAEAHRAELGDLLLQIAFQAQIRSEEGAWGFDDVAEAIADKMERRHPHVFGELTVTSVEEVRGIWDSIKQAEGRESALDGVPRALPALSRAARIGDKAASVGFDWPDIEGVVDKAHEELAELAEARATGDAAAIEDELGDVLFSLVNLARHLKVDPEGALRRSTAKFERRFREMERALRATGGLEGLDIEAMERAWQAAKEILKDEAAPRHDAAHS
ncbi:nucleoside triphosphate pyrophosphohydrolase [Myxococcota bacterium]|nr:nucleoside triphosphate pyrophosphohydrolase [Myxococcota bacterium]